MNASRTCDSVQSLLDLVPVLVLYSGTQLPKLGHLLAELSSEARSRVCPHAVVGRPWTLAPDLPCCLVAALKGLNLALDFMCHGTDRDDLVLRLQRKCVTSVCQASIT